MGNKLTVESIDLKGKNVIVTGGNAGIGQVTSRELAKMGAKVIIACRDQTRAEASIKKMREEAPTFDLDVEYLNLDLTSFDSIRQFAAEFNKRDLPLHVLINNAGIMMLEQREVTKDGLEKQMGTNHFGHFLLTNLLLEPLKRANGARVVTVSSLAHDKFSHMDWNDLQLERGYTPTKAYGNSKLANVMFARGLQKRSTEHGWNIQSYSVHPGVIITDLYNNMSGIKGAVVRSVRPFARDVETGAKTTLYCAVAPEASENLGGYFADCKPHSMNSVAQDDEKVEFLWQKSEELVGLAK